MIDFSDVTVGELICRISVVLAALSTVVQISPIKINPWSWIAKKIGNALTRDLLTKIDTMEKDIERIGAGAEEHAAKDARSHILRFGDEIRHGVQHSKDHFDEILQYISEYTKYCEDHKDFKNKITESTTKCIIKQYEDCLEHNTFL